MSIAYSLQQLEDNGAVFSMHSFTLKSPLFIVVKFLMLAVLYLHIQNTACVSVYSSYCILFCRPICLYVSNIIDLNNFNIIEFNDSAFCQSKISLCHHIWLVSLINNIMKCITCLQGGHHINFSMEHFKTFLMAVVSQCQGHCNPLATPVLFSPSIRL